MADRLVLLAGATGLVGGECLRRLVADPGVAQVRVLLRRPLPGGAPHPKVTQAVVDFERLAEKPELFVVDQVLCALGTTIRQAGSQAAFRRVDHDFPVEVGRLALATGASRIATALLGDAIATDIGNRDEADRRAVLRTGAAGICHSDLRITGCQWGGDRDHEAR